jgi:elongation factor Ts
MAGYTPQDVKRLRDETGAGIMDCKNALEEAGGDFEGAKAVLREKGIAQAGKRAGRSTNAGVVAVASSDDHKTIGAIVLESETDFVARNEDFIALANKIAEAVRDNVGDDPLKIQVNGSTVGDLITDAVGKIRENIQLTKAVRLTSNSPIASYVHHDKTKGSVVVIEGEGSHEAIRKVAIQAVASPPEVVSKDQLSQERIDAEIEVEMKRAIGEGKDEKIAKNIAQGRVNKEYVKKVVLLEQPFYMDPSKSVGQYLKEEAKGANVKDFLYLSVGGGE